MVRQRGSLIVFAAFIMALTVLLLAGFVGLVLATPLPNPTTPQATLLLDRDGQLIARLFVEERVDVPLGQMPTHLLQAVVAVEDVRFFSHRGIDPLGLARALVRNLQAGAVVEGGSTITQQLARNLFLTHERTVARKLREALLTLKLEMAYTKPEILQMYLNTIYLGSGTYGVEVAAQTYFGKGVQDLSLAESALLAGLPRAPEVYSPFIDPDAARQRRNVVLNRLAELGHIDAEQAHAAAAEPLNLAEPRPAAGLAPYFTDYVVTLIRRHHPDIAADLLRGGYRITTTLDLPTQTAAEAALAAGLPPGEPGADGILQPQGALVALDPQSGAILAMIGGRSHAQSPFNRATQAERQPGSAFKPFLYTALLATNYWTAANVQLCELMEFPLGPGQPPWRPRDWDRPAHFRPIAVREAIRISDNVVAARWVWDLGVDLLRNMAGRMGIDSPLHGQPSLALGTAEVTLLAMTRAYASLANGGRRVEPLAFTRIEDALGRVVAEQRPAASQVIDARVAYIMTNIMKEVVRPGGSAGQVSGLIGGRPAAGKTGTTEHNRDAWFLGFTTDIVAGVWVGHDDEGQTLAQTAAFLAAPLWGDFIARSQAEQPHQEFARPAGIVERLVCPETGLLANGTRQPVRELFLAGTEPKQYCPVDHRRR